MRLEIEELTRKGRQMMIKMMMMMMMGVVVVAVCSCAVLQGQRRSEAGHVTYGHEVHVSCGGAGWSLQQRMPPPPPPPLLLLLLMMMRLVMQLTAAYQ
jgi:hypothetical protein